MSCGNEHVAHDELWFTEYLCVDALQDEVALPGVVRCNEERMIDVALPEFRNVNDITLLQELPSDGIKIIQKNSLLPLFTL
jgi:hypothetical protein